MIKSSESFIYNGQLSTDFGIINCTISKGLMEESFLPSSEIIEITTRNRDIPFFQKIQHKPFEFNITFAFIEAWNDEKLASLARLFYVKFFSPMIFSENPSKIYYCIPVGDPIISHNGKQGYVTMNFKCNSPWAVSNIYSSPIYDLTSNPVEGTTISLTNSGDIPMAIKIDAEIISGSTFLIQNMSDGGKYISFSSLDVGEVLTINTENEDITTSKLLSYRYDAMEGEFLQIPRGVNNLKILGSIKLQFNYQFRLLQS